MLGEIKLQNCNSCDCEVTEAQGSLICNICSNHFHLNGHCLRLTNLSGADNKFTCYQCVDDDSLQTNIEIDRNELLERDNLENLVLNPHQREAFWHHDKILFNDNSQDLDKPPNPISNFYSSEEFNDLTQSERLSSDNLSFFHLNIGSINFL